MELSSPEERRSSAVFGTMLTLVAMACAFPQMPAEALFGILWTVTGFLMVIRPPEFRLRRTWIALGVGFILASSLGFLPRSWFIISPWRTEVEAFGLKTGGRVFLEPMLAAEGIAITTATTLSTLFLLGHRVSSSMVQRLALVFGGGVGIWTVFALWSWHPGGLFGLFPNRNHTATLLVMGTMVAIGTLAQAVRMRNGWQIAVSAVSLAPCLWALLVVSESRAGIVLISIGLLVWILGSGTTVIKGNAGKAILLLVLAFGGVFLISESAVKSRITDSLQRIKTQQITPAVAGNNPGHISFEDNSAAHSAEPLDGRIGIFQDTASMIRSEPWVGVGPGQFAGVFPQYRSKTSASNDAIVLHPESDWLFMLAEHGWLAALALLSGLGLVFFKAFTGSRRGNSRPLRMACWVAALLLCIHGLFDVPAHRIGLLLGAVFLLGLTLRPPMDRRGRLLPGPSRAARLIWRSAGFVLLTAGGILLHAHFSNSPVLPSARAERLTDDAKHLYEVDQSSYEKARAEGREYQPLPGEDPLEEALKKVGEALEITPLNSHLHYVRGALALHFDDKTEIANEAFAIQRRLVPTRINVAVDQAQAWSKQDPKQVLTLWKEALRRATAEETRGPGRYPGVMDTYQRALKAAGNDEALASAALELAGNEPSLRIVWARSAPAPLLDREMPRLLLNPRDTSSSQLLFQSWEKRGSKDAATKFAQNHPELHFSTP